MTVTSTCRVMLRADFTLSMEISWKPTRIKSSSTSSLDVSLGVKFMGWSSKMERFADIELQGEQNAPCVRAETGYGRRVLFLAMCWLDPGSIELHIAFKMIEFPPVYINFAHFCVFV